MSACYSTIAAGASAAAVDGSASYALRSGESTADAAFGVLNAIGGCLFAFGGQVVLLEIQVRCVVQLPCMVCPAPTCIPSLEAGALCPRPLRTACVALPGPS